MILLHDVVMYYMEKTNTEKKVVDVLKKNKEGMTITELVKSSDLSRSTVRVALARLEGKEDISFRNIGMAKVYIIGGSK